MSYQEELNRTKLEMLQALTRSQIALAGIMEHTAVSATHYRIPVSLIEEQLRSLASYQSTMIAQLSGIQLKVVRLRKPTHRPWLNSKISCCKLV